MYIRNFVPISDNWLQDVESDTTLAKGKDYANQERIKLTSCEKEGDLITLSAQARSVNSDEQYDVSIEFAYDGMPISYDCDCPAFMKYDGLCKHCVATILTYNRFYANEIIPKLKTMNTTGNHDAQAVDDVNPMDGGMLGVETVGDSAAENNLVQKYWQDATATIGQNSRGVLSIQPIGSPPIENAAEYYRYQHERRNEEEKARQEKLALKRTTNILTAYKQIVMNEVKTNGIDHGQANYVTLVPVLEMDGLQEGILLGFQIRRRSEREMTTGLHDAEPEALADTNDAVAGQDQTDDRELLSTPVNQYPRAYVIKAIDDLMGSVSRHEHLNFGKELSFRAEESAFDPVSLKWSGFLERRFAECRRISTTYMYMYGQKARRIKLTDAALDEMFEKFGDSWFRIGENASDYRKVISSEAPTLTVSLEGNQDGAITLSCAQMKSLYLGTDSTSDRQIAEYQYGANWMTGERRPAKPPRHVYIKSDYQLRRFSAEASAAIAPLLLGLMDERGKLTFPKEQTWDLFVHLLPEVSKYITILDPSGLLGQGTTDTVTGRILLDAPDKERVTAILLAGYRGIWLDTHSGQAVGQTSEDGSGNMNWDVAGLDTSAIKRDYHAEQRFLAQTGAVLGFNQADVLSFLATDEDGTIAAGSPEQPIVVSGNDRLYHLLKDGISKLQIMGDVLVTQKMRNLTVEAPRKVTVGVMLDSGLLKLNIDTGGIDIAEMHAIIRAYHEKKSYYRLKNGSFLDLSDETADAFVGMDELSKIEQGLQLSEEELLDGEVEVPAFRAMYLDGLFNDAVSLGCRKDEAFQALTSRIKDFAHAAFPIPETLENVLRPYQKTGYQWLRCLESCSFCGILADDMGLGKSVQFLSVLLAHDSRAGCSAGTEGTPDNLPSLIVCPSSLVLNWEKEAVKFAPSLAVRVVQGALAERRERIRNIQARELVITSYDLLRRDEAEYKSVQFHYFAIDEAQYIKNYTTQAAKAVKKINCKQRFALTGTPIENRLSELWSIFDFLMPGYLYRYSRFKKQFEAPITKDNNETAKSNLRRMILPFVLRRLKSEVLTELPPKTTTVVSVELSEKQMELYNATLLTGLQALKSEKGRPEGVAKMQVLALLTKLRRLCCAPSLCFDTFKYGSSKLDVCTELLEQSQDGGHRVLLFSQYTDMLDLIEARVKSAGMSYLRLQGSTPVKDRLELVDTFNKGETDVFLISLKAGGTGLNLTAADTVIHYDPWWNLAAQDQATDRAYRIGQEKKVQVYKLIAQNTIEEKILKLQEMKKDLAAIIDSDNDEGSLMSMSTDEIVDLLRDR